MGKKHKKHHKSEKERTEVKSEEGEKPLKLVLRVPGTSDIITEQKHDDGKKHKHKKKKKKKSSDKEKHRHEKHEHERKEKQEKPEKPEKRKREVEVDVVEGEVDIIEEPNEIPLKKSLLDSEFHLHRRLREPRSMLPDEEKSCLQLCLDYLHVNLQRKDVNGFFAFPVTDVIAPNYSQIIAQPMDFSTMKEKIDDNEYKNVTEYKKDYRNMCDNCMTYNRPETIYYKTAEKLMHAGVRSMTKEKLLYMKRSLGFMANITADELGLDNSESGGLDGIDAEDSMLVKALKTKPKSKASRRRFEAIPDNLAPHEILAQAQAAAREAAESLTLRNPDCKIGFLRRRKDGSTSLNIINPDDDGIINETERVISIGSLVGKLSQGTGAMAGFKEDKRNKATPVTYLNYGPFSTYAPSYDSSFSTIPKEDSDLLLSTYGDETATQYATSLRDFVADASYTTVYQVDRLLDVLTGGEHSKTITVLQEKQKKEEELRKKEEKIKSEAAEENKSCSINFDSLRSLSNVGIDVGFLDAFEKQYQNEEHLQAKLDETSQLLCVLQKTQNERLSGKLPVHLSHVQGFSEKESQLAGRVTKGLTELTKQVRPQDIVSANAIRASLGVGLHPGNAASQSDGAAPDENEDGKSQAMTHMSNEDAHAVELELKDFLEQGPTLRVCDSPSMVVAADNELPGSQEQPMVIT